LFQVQGVFTYKGNLKLQTSNLQHGSAAEVCDATGASSVLLLPVSKIKAALPAYMVFKGVSLSS
jgi:hypothetical protein